MVRLDPDDPVHSFAHRNVGLLGPRPEEGTRAMLDYLTEEFGEPAVGLGIALAKHTAGRTWFVPSLTNFISRVSIDFDVSGTGEDISAVTYDPAADRILRGTVRMGWTPYDEGLWERVVRRAVTRVEQRHDAILINWENSWTKIRPDPDSTVDGEYQRGIPHFLLDGTPHHTQARFMDLLKAIEAVGGEVYGHE